MQTTIIQYVYLLSICAAGCTSVVSFRYRYPWHLKLFAINLLLTLGVEAVTITNATFHFGIRNNSIYNVSTPVAFVFYGLFYYHLYRSITAKRLTIVFIVLFPIFSMITSIFVFGFEKWNSFMMIVGCIAAVLFAVRYYYEIFTSPDLIRLNKSPEFWIATGMVILYSCQIPFFGALNYLVNNYLQLAMDLHQVMLVVNTIMYLMFTYGYLCRINTAKS